MPNTNTTAISNFELHDKATTMADAYTKYQLARQLILTKEQHNVTEQMLDLHKDTIDSLLKANNTLMEHINLLQCELESCKANSVKTEKDWRVQYELEC